MQLINRTPYAALSYSVVDSSGEEHHVVVARGAYELRPAPPSAGGEADAPTHVAELATAELSFTDVYHGEMNLSSVKYESDLAQMKPRCDVIVIGAAHSPTGEPAARVDVAVRVERTREIPAIARPGVLLERHLAVHGARELSRRGDRWEMSDPEPFVELPLRYEHAFGGELKVYANDAAAERLRDEHRLRDDVRARHPEAEAAPVAHTTCMHNPLGKGFLERWYADAAEVERWPAPRIEAPGAGITAELFGRMVAGEVRPGEVPGLSPCGVGVIAKPWQPRLALAGTLDDRWLAERWPNMPDDFDMAYWNGAHRDMQCEHLYGGERVEIRNMLPRGAPGAAVEAAGVACRFEVPDAGVMAGFAGGGSGAVGLVTIDTLIVDLEEMSLAVVWRVVAPVAAGFEHASLLALGHQPPPAPA